MTQKQKKGKKWEKHYTDNEFFLQNRKNPETETFVFCIIMFEPIKI